MSKEYCNIKVTEVENGYNIEVTGDEIKDKCKTIIENCSCFSQVKSEEIKKGCC